MCGAIYRNPFIPPRLRGCAVISNDRKMVFVIDTLGRTSMDKGEKSFRARKASNLSSLDILHEVGHDLCQFLCLLDCHGIVQAGSDTTY